MSNVNSVQYYVTQNLMQNIANKQKHTHAYFKSNLSNVTTKYGQRTFTLSLLNHFLCLLSHDISSHYYLNMWNLFHFYYSDRQSTECGPGQCSGHSNLVRARWWRDHLSGGRDFLHPSRPALVPTQPPTQWVPGHSWGLSGWGVALTIHPHLVPRLKEEHTYTSTTLLGPRGLFYGELYLFYPQSRTQHNIEQIWQQILFFHHSWQQK